VTRCKDIDILNPDTWHACFSSTETRHLTIHFDKSNWIKKNCYVSYDYDENKIDRSCFRTAEELFDVIESRFGFGFDDFREDP